MKPKIVTNMFACFLALSIVSQVIANDNAGGPERVPVLIGFNHTPGSSEQALVRSHGGEVKFSYRLVPAIAAWIPEPAIKGLLRNPNVTRVEPDVKVYTVDTELDASWGVKRIGAGMVHSSGNRGAGVTVAIIDTGIEKDPHPDLTVLGGRNFVHKTTGPPSKRYDPDDWDDDHGHGTHCAGIVAALDNGIGVVGVAPQAELYALKVFGGESGAWISNVIAALDWVTTNDIGIEVTSNSYGTLDDPGEIFQAAFVNSAASPYNIVHVCAAGNSGNVDGTGDSVIYPAKYESCVSVAAIDENDDRASFSSTGPLVDVAAPGVAVYSTLPGESYGYKSGTSMATPHVAGVVALMIADGGYTKYGLTSTADDLGIPGFDEQYGWGLVNAAKAVGISNTSPTVSITSPADGSSFVSGATIAFTGTASDAEDDDTALTSGIVWTSSIDEQIGIGGSISAALSNGVHEITASATDSGSLTGSSTITITVGTPSPVTIVHVSSINYGTQGGSDGKKHLLINVFVADDTDEPVSGALVEIETLLGTSVYAIGTSTTGADGAASFRLTNAPSGEYTTNVLNVTGTGLLWDGINPATTYSK